MFTAYILVCSDGTYHFGVTKNLNARLAYHEEGQNESSYTFTRRPIRLVHQKSFDDIRTAITYEAALKTKSNQEVAQIISGELQLDIATSAIIETSETETTSIISPASYLGNLAYFANIKPIQEIILDVNERFQKQSYRSRCTILSANGLQNLIVPVVRPNGKETLMNDILISYTEDWQKDHIKAIESAYRRAPYFEYYADELFEILQKKHEKLVDLSLELTHFLMSCFGIECKVRISQKEENSSIELKNEMYPKSRTNFQAQAYQQVLNKGDFENNLSAIDLLFNCGKNGINLID